MDLSGPAGKVTSLASAPSNCAGLNDFTYSMVFASRCCNSSNVFSVSGVDGTSLCGQPRAAFGGEIADELDLPVQRQHVRIKPRVEQHLGLDVLRLRNALPPW